jgi:hypothetical protein
VNRNDNAPQRDWQVAPRGGKGQQTPGKNHHLHSKTIVDHSISCELDGACGILAAVACDLADVARHQQTARKAKLATDALKVAESALRLADALHTELEV